MQIKVCGITQQQQATALLQMPLQYIGFIFYAKSPRYVQQKIVIENASKRIVGVFVNPTEEEIEFALHLVPSINTLQFHGNEMPEFCKKYKSTFTIIKAISVDGKIEINELVEPYLNVVDLFLFDTKAESYGGSGQQFNWSILNSYTGSIPFLLSGGIGISDVENLRKLQHPRLIGVDVNSKFELAAGIKDLDLVSEFVERVVDGEC